MCVNVHLLGLRAALARPALPFFPRLVPRLPSASAARLARQRSSSGAAEARRRSPRQAPGAHASVWCEIWRQALACLAESDDTSSGDDEHNTSNAFLLWCATAHTAPVLLAGLTHVDEPMVALGCRFALDVFTVAQQGLPFADHDSLNHDHGHALWR